MRHQNFIHAMNIAISNAKQSTERFLIGAAIVNRRGNLIGYGKNSIKTHPLQAKYGVNYHKVHLHAEIDAIISCKDKSRLANSTLFLVRLTRNGNMAPIHPCKGCARALIDYGIEKIVYYSKEGVVEMADVYSFL